MSDRKSGIVDSVLEQRTVRSEGPQLPGLWRRLCAAARGCDEIESGRPDRIWLDAAGSQGAAAELKRATAEFVPVLEKSEKA